MGGDHQEVEEVGPVIQAGALLQLARPDSPRAMGMGTSGLVVPSLSSTRA